MDKPYRATAASAFGCVSVAQTARILLRIIAKWSLVGKLPGDAACRRPYQRPLLLTIPVITITGIDIHREADAVSLQKIRTRAAENPEHRAPAIPLHRPSAPPGAGSARPLVAPWRKIHKAPRGLQKGGTR